MIDGAKALGIAVIGIMLFLLLPFIGLIFLGAIIFFFAYVFIREMREEKLQQKYEEAKASRKEQSQAQDQPCE